MRPLIALLAALLLPACTSTPVQDAPEVAIIAPGIRFVTPAPRELGYEIEAVQLVTARYGEEQFVFEGHVSAAPDRLTLVALDPFGRRALTATRTAQEVRLDAAEWLPRGLRAANILADMAIVYWPEEAVRRGLAGTSATLETGPGQRRILVGGREVIRVSYDAASPEPWMGTAQYRNAALGYGLDLRSAVVR